MSSLSLYYYLHYSLNLLLLHYDRIKALKAFKHPLQNIKLYFTDDMFTSSGPSKSQQECFAIIKFFSELSSYSVNWSKSTILLLNVVKGRWMSWHHFFFTSTQKMSNMSALLYFPGCQSYLV